MGFSIILYDRIQKPPRVELDIIPENFSELFKKLNLLFPTRAYCEAMTSGKYIVFHNGKIASLTNKIKLDDKIMILEVIGGG